MTTAATATASAKVVPFLPVGDPVYDMTHAPAPYDGATMYRQTRITAPTTGASATIAAPLNSAGQSRTVISLVNGGGVRYRWGTMALRLQMVFTLGNNTAAAADPTRCSPPWNMIPYLFQSLSVSINRGSTQIVNFPDPLSFGAAFTAKMLREYTYDQLNHMDNVLFTPLDGPNDAYISATPADSQYNAAVNPGAVQRGLNWIGANSHQRVITKILPFKHLFPTMPDSVWSNITNIDIGINWVTSGDILESANIVAAIGSPDATRGQVSLIACDVLEDAYVQTPTTALTSVSQKGNLVPDIIPCIFPTVNNLPYTPGGTIVVGNMPNVDCAFILQPARGQTNGKAAGNLITYSSFGQFLLFGNGLAPNTLGIVRADTPIAAGYLSPITSIGMNFGNTQYPTSNVITTTTTNATVCLDPAELYFHYLRAADKISRTEASASIPEIVFRRTMPFVCFRPWGRSPHVSSSGDLIKITMAGGGASNVMVILFQTKAFVIQPDGTVQETMT